MGLNGGSRQVKTCIFVDTSSRSGIINRNQRGHGDLRDCRGLKPSLRASGFFKNMKLLKIRYVDHWSFIADYKCEVCGSVQRESREKKRYIIKNFLPHLQCRRCGNSGEKKA